MIDISSLLSKIANEAQASNTAGINANEKLTALEFVEKIVKPIRELQNAVTALQDNNTLSVSTLTRSSYNALTEKNSSTLYCVLENNCIVAMYLGIIPFNFVAYSDTASSETATVTNFTLGTSVLDGANTLG